MAELRDWQELPTGGAIPARAAPRIRTGGWRTGVKPRVELASCVNCLLCWVYCPDAAIRVEKGTFVGVDYDFCKGCEICAEICPAGAIEMVPEDADVG
jgi:2-oxoacid:acceptor oxidoreductase delta subunit (pyruvate/2-ketoisovalerate family)